MIELPVTTTQDYTLFHVLNELSIDLWKIQIDLILRKNGLMSFIVHPDYIIEPEKLSIYEACWAACERSRRRAPSGLPFRVRSTRGGEHAKMSVVNEEGSWRIEGDETKRALLAYAKVVDGKLVYELEHASGRA